MQVGALRIGVGAFTEEQDLALRAALGDFVVDDPSVPLNYLTRFATERNELNLLYWGDCVVAAERSADGLLAALASHLGAHRPAASGTVRIRGHLLWRHDRAVLLPNSDLTAARRVAASLADLGVALETAPHHDVSTANALIEPPTPLALDHSAFAATRADRAGRAAAPVVRAHPVMLTGVLHPGVEHAGSRAERLVALVGGRFVDPGLVNVNALAELTGHVDVLSAPDHALIVDNTRWLLERTL